MDKYSMGILYPETVLENVKAVRNRKAAIPSLTRILSSSKSVLKGICMAGILSRFAITYRNMLQVQQDLQQTYYLT